MFPYLTWFFFTSEECWEAHLYMLFLLGEIYFVYSNHLAVLTGHARIGQASTNYLNENLETTGFLCSQIHWIAASLGISYENFYY